MKDDSLRGPRRVARDVALTGLSQSAIMVAGGVLAVLVAAKFGGSAETDGFFAAYGVYSIIVLFAQACRTSVVAIIVASPNHYRAFDRLLGSAALVFAATGVVFVGLGETFAALATGSLPEASRSVATHALLVLWPAAGAQLFAALAAAMLGVLGNFTRAAFAYAAGGITSIAAFLALEPVLGIDSLAVAVLLGSAVAAVPLAIALMRTGWRPDPGSVFHLLGNLRLTGVLIVACAFFLTGQVAFVISLAFAARLGEGTVTTYTYAFLALSLLIALVGSSVSTVLAAPFAATWDRDPKTLTPHARAVFTVALLILAPVFAAAALIGDELGELLLRGLTAQEIERTVDVFLLLSPVALLAAAIAVPLIGFLTLGRYGHLALLSLAVIVLHAGLSLAAIELGGVRALAVAATASSLAGAALLLVLVYGRSISLFAFALGREAIMIGLLGASCFGASTVLLHAVGVRDAGAVAWLIGILAFSVALAALPAYRAVLVQLAQSLRRSERTA